MTRLYGRAPKGERGLGAVPQNYGAKVTMLAALGSQGGEAVMTSDGAPDAEVCRVYIEQVLRPTLCPGDIVIMDNLQAHKAAGIHETIEQTGARLQYLPPYLPDLSPIERCWSKLKTYLRKANARTREALETAIAEPLAFITSSTTWWAPPTWRMADYKDIRLLETLRGHDIDDDIATAQALLDRIAQRLSRRDLKLIKPYSDAMTL